MANQTIKIIFQVSASSPRNVRLGLAILAAEVHSNLSQRIRRPTLTPPSGLAQPAGLAEAIFGRLLDLMGDEPPRRVGVNILPVFRGSRQRIYISGVQSRLQLRGWPRRDVDREEARRLYARGAANGYEKAASALAELDAQAS